MKKVGRTKRVYNSAANRRRATAQLIRYGNNYFLGFRNICDPQQEIPMRFGLSYGVASWVGPGEVLQNV